MARERACKQFVLGIGAVYSALGNDCVCLNGYLTKRVLCVRRVPVEPAVGVVLPYLCLCGTEYGVMRVSVPGFN